jgi:hypothetical protein
MCATDTFYVGRLKSYDMTDIQNGLLAHLQMTSNGQAVSAPEMIVPPPSAGRWSRYNVDGYMHVRKDLPKIDKAIGGWLVPNFGDWNKGSHTHSSIRKVFQKERWYGQDLPVAITVGEVTGDHITIGFRVEKVFDRTNLNQRELKYACSLLRENVNTHVAVVSTGVSVSDWLADQHVTWEILPEGQANFDTVITRLNSKISGQRKSEMQDRYEAINELKPSATVVGHGGFSRYFGFMFRDDLVALENLDYGNALYLMFEDWKELSQRSRIDLIADTDAHYDRIVHRKDWRLKLIAALKLRGHDTNSL